MKGHGGGWQVLGKLLEADRRHPWFCSHTGACAVLPIAGSDDRFELFITVRDDENRSVIGKGEMRLSEENGQIAASIEVEAEPAVQRGELGMFDENGVSYPWAVRDGDRTLLYYTGWMPTVLTPFQNHLGLAMSHGGAFQRVSRAPILPRSDVDPLSIGSCAVLRHGGVWHMWYTSFLGWGTRPGEPKHRYVIKRAESDNGVEWRRDGTNCIEPAYGWDHSIGRPTVWHDGQRFHMWFCYRGDHYRIGYASSDDGITWERDDALAGIDGSGETWDSRDQCYPFVLQAGERLLMLYCGNDYGNGGVGIAERFL